MKKPVLVVEMVERRYWQCARKEHRHMTEEVAQRCLERHPTEAAPRGRVNHWTPESRAEALALRRSGLTYRAVGERYGISANRAKQVCDRAEYRERVLEERARRQQEES